MEFSAAVDIFVLGNDQGATVRGRSPNWTIWDNRATRASSRRDKLVTATRNPVGRPARPISIRGRASDNL